MPVDTLDGFIEELRKNRLLKPAQFDEVVRILQPRFSGSSLLAKELVRRGWLTVYQINQLFQANGQQLVLGNYRIVDYLGKGGVSQVFKAYHIGQDCLVAVKVIHPHLVCNAEAVARFQREMKAVASLSHPNIVRAFEDDAIGNAHFFAMEFVEGTSLDKLAQLSGALPVPQACDYIRQAALGLQHAHEQGLVHRDLKPANLVLITGTSLIKILDLGLARLRVKQDEASTSLTVQGAMIGTPDYVSPEQARDARSVDIRADIYSLGCTLYFLLTGAPPFPGGSAMQKIYNHLNKEPTPASVLCSDLPPEVGDIIKKMMAKKAEDRYQVPQEVADALTPFCAG